MIKIAYVGAHLASYMAEEHNVFSESIAGLKLLADKFAFELIVIDSPISTRSNAKCVADSLEDGEVDFVIFQHASFAMGDLILEFINRKFRLGIWATEEPSKEGPIPLNNFVSMNLQAGILTRYLKQQNIPFKWFYGACTHKWFKARLQVTVRAIQAIKTLKSSKIGLVGGVAPSFYNLVCDERELLSRWGVEVQSHEMSDLFARAQSAPSEQIKIAIEAMKKAGKVEISDRDLKVSALIYLGMKDLAKEHKYDALAISDWPAFQSELNIHPGMAFSWLDHNDGIPVASEGDVLGATSMLIMNAINQDKSMLLNMNDLDETRDAVLMGHCGGSPLNFANYKGIRWINHSTLNRNSDRSNSDQSNSDQSNSDQNNPDNPSIGAIADLQFAAQKTTLFRLTQDGKQMFVADATIIESPHAGFDGSRGWLSNFQMSGESVELAHLVNTIMVEGIEHQYVLAKGHHEAVVQEVAAWLDLKIVQKQNYQNYLQRPN